MTTLDVVMYCQHAFAVLVVGPFQSFGKQHLYGLSHRAALLSCVALHTLTDRFVDVDIQPLPTTYGLTLSMRSYSGAVGCGRH